MSQSMNDFAPNAEILSTNANSLVVGKGVHIKGEIHNCELLKLEGIIEGSVEDVSNLSVESGGTFDGAAIVGYAKVSGELNGRIVVKDRLTITTTGKVEGKINYGELEIGRGGTLNGRVKRSTMMSKNAQPIKTNIVEQENSD